MPRIRQLASQYAEADRKKAEQEFWYDVEDHANRTFGIRSNTGIGKAVGLSASCISNYKDDPGVMQVRTVRKFVETFKPNISVLLRLFGYSDKEIKRFAQSIVN